MDWQGFQDWLDHLQQLGGQYQFTDQDIANLGLMMNYESANQQQQQNDLASRQNDYNNRQLDYQYAQLPYQYDQLGYQQDQLDFQRGPQMDFNRANIANQLTESNNNVQMSADDVLKSANYLQQQRYGTDAAKYQADVARYNAMQAMGMVAPQGLSLADPRLASLSGHHVARFSALGY